jgi:enterochelin esterase-like enzyme
MRFAALVSPALLLLGACSGTSDPVAAPPAAGGTTGGSASPSPSPTGGSGGAGGGVIASGGQLTGGMSGGGAGGSGGMLASSGSGGAGGAEAGGSGGAAGSAGSGGALPVGCSEAGPVGKTGRQCDPGTMGNGTFNQMQPQDGRPPEADGDPAGELSDQKTLQSTVFGYGFRYRTYKPTAYVTGKPAALMIFQDGGNYTGNFHAPRVFDSLITEGTVPVTISVYIEPTNRRSVEYDTRSDKYGKMITTELVPELAKTFDLVEDPDGWAIGGHSSGGGCAFNVAWWFPDKFHKVMTHSGTFVGLQDPGNDEYIQLVKTEKKPLRTTLLSGTNDLACCGTTWFAANNSMAQSLEEAGYPYRYMKSTTEHGPTMWHTADFPDALRWLWKGYTLPHYGPPK